MKIIKALSGGILGCAAASVACWGALYCYGAILLRGKGSLFDTSPNIANAFFLAWGIASLIFAIFGAVLCGGSLRK